MNVELIKSIIEGVSLVPEGKVKITDFIEHDKLGIENLGVNVAVVTYQKGKGSIAHMTNASNINDYYLWLKENIEPETNAYIVGGQTGKSEVLVSTLEDVVKKVDLNLVGKEIFGRLRRNIVLKKDGMLVIEYYTQYKDANLIVHTVPKRYSKVSLSE